jgi:hypothetical protein
MSADTLVEIDVGKLTPNSVFSYSVNPTSTGVLSLFLFAAVTAIAYAQHDAALRQMKATQML